MIPAQFQQMETGNLEMNFGPRKGYGLHLVQSVEYVVFVLPSFEPKPNLLPLFSPILLHPPKEHLNLKVNASQREMHLLDMD